VGKKKGRIKIRPSKIFLAAICA